MVLRVCIPFWNLAASHLRWFVGGKPLPPLVLWAPALVVGVALLLPPVYLVFRTFGGGGELWELLFRERVAEILGRTLLLVVSVTAAAILLALPLAWLTVRTDLPLRRAWTVLTTLPLVMPSYVAGFIVVVALGPKGMLQGVLEGPFGIERFPDIQGFVGAMLTLTFLSYPYVLITLRAGLLRLDPALEESARGLGLGPWAVFFRVICPLLRPALAVGGLLTGLYTLSDFGAVSLLEYETFTWAIFLQYESALDRTLGAGLSLALVVLALGWVGLEVVSRGRGRYFSASAAPTRTPSLVRLGTLEVGGTSGLLRRRRHLPAAADVGPGLLGGAWRGGGGVNGRGLGGGQKFSVYFSIGRTGHRGRGGSLGDAIGAVPWVAKRVLGAIELRRFRPSRHRGSLGLGVFRHQLRPAPVPDRRYIVVGLRRSVPLPGIGRGAGLVVANQPAHRGGGPRTGPGPGQGFHIGHVAGGPPRNPGGGILGLPADHEGVASHADTQPDRIQHAGDVHLVGGVRSVLRPGGHPVVAANRGLGGPAYYHHASGKALGYNLARPTTTNLL